MALSILYLLACHVRVTVGDSGLLLLCSCDVVRMLINSLVSLLYPLRCLKQGSGREENECVTLITLPETTQ